MKYLAALFVMVTFVGCGETTKDIVERVNSTGSITDEQVESLSKVQTLRISAACQPLIDKYKNQ